MMSPPPHTWDLAGTIRHIVFAGLSDDEIEARRDPDWPIERWRAGFLDYIVQRGRERLEVAARRGKIIIFGRRKDASIWTAIPHAYWLDGGRINQDGTAARGDDDRWEDLRFDWSEARELRATLDIFETATDAAHAFILTCRGQPDKEIVPKLQAKFGLGVNAAKKKIKQVFSGRKRGRQPKYSV